MADNPKRRWQTVELDRLFSGPGETISGWFFAVTPAFKEALEVQWRKQGREMVWASPDRPAFSFRIGDILYDHRGARRVEAQWSTVVREIRWSIQVHKATASSLSVDQTSVSEGTVVFELRRVGGGSGGQVWTSPAVTQSEFVEVLRTGALPGHPCSDKPYRIQLST